MLKSQLEMDDFILLRGHVRMLAEGGKRIVKALWAAWSSPLGHTWPGGLSLPTSDTGSNNTRLHLLWKSESPGHSRIWNNTMKQTSETIQHWRNTRSREGEREMYFFPSLPTFANQTNCAWAHPMKHFDIIYIHKWNCGWLLLPAPTGCEKFMTDKKESRQMCHLLEFKYGTLNMWGTRLRYQPPNGSSTPMLVWAPRSLCLCLCVCLCVQMLCVFITTCMFPCVRQVWDSQTINNIWQTVKHDDCVCACVFRLRRHMSPCC